MSTIENALQIAARAHQGRHDRQGMPYILHPLRVMARVDYLEAKIVAILHDVVEDTSTTFDDLKRSGFAEEILEAVRRLTRAVGESYADYVVGCRVDSIARRVKMADLLDNSDLDRLGLSPRTIRRDMVRSTKYGLSYAFLDDRITEEEYRESMANL